MKRPQCSGERSNEIRVNKAKRCARSLKRKRVMEGRQRIKTERSVWDHGAVFLPKVKGKLARGKINKEGIEVHIHPGRHFTDT